MKTESLFVKCKVCGKDISKSLKVCPKCGARQKKIGVIHWVGIALIGLIFIALFSNNKSGDTAPPSNANKNVSPPIKTKQTPTVYKSGQTVTTGYMSYAVWGSEWSSTLGDNRFVNQKPDAAYLIVDMTVRNDDKEARSFPPPELVDENGATYEASADGWMLDNALSILDSLNPGVEKRGVVIFDVPPNNSYKLKVSGGFWSSDAALVELNPG